MTPRAVFFTLLLAIPAVAAPLPIAHRGLLLDAPENTLAAFGACLDLNLGFELDVQRSRDGELVVLHDADLKRTTSGSGAVSTHSLADLRKLDAGRWFDPAFAGEKIPTLDEVFALVKARARKNCLVAVDIKIADDRVEADIVRLARKHAILDQIVCIGTTINSPAVRQRLLQADRATPTAMLAQTPADLPRLLADRDARWAYLRFVPTPEQVQRLHAAGKKVLIAGTTVSGRETANWLKARDAGVDALLTDHPLDCRRACRSTRSRPAAKQP